MKTKTFKQLGYRVTPLIIDMIKKCEAKSANMYQVQRDELQRIKDKYINNRKQLSPNQLTYLNLLYTNFVLKGEKMSIVKENNITKPKYNHIGMKLLNNI